MRRFAIPSLLALVFMLPTAVADQGVELFDPATGTAVTLPEEWDFAIAGPRLVASSPDRQAMVVLVEAGEDFEDEAMRIDQEIAEHVLTDVVVDEAVILIGADRGALAGAVAARGKAVDKRDGAPVDFFALLVQGAEGDGGLVLGAWKDAKHAATIEQVVNSVHVREPGLEAGLELRDKRTGAAVKVPEGWSIFSSRAGLMAVEPERQAMAILMAPEQNFRETVVVVRAILRRRFFDDVNIGEFTTTTGQGAEGAFEVLRATGTAKDRADGADVELMAILAHRVEENSGILIVGSWKDPAFKAPIASMLESLELPERKETAAPALQPAK